MQTMTAAMAGLSTLKPTLSAELAPSPPLPSLPLPLKAVAEVFRSLNAQLGARVADLYAGVPAQDVQAEWARQLAGFQRHELERGLRASSERRWAPTLGEFKHLCRPALDAEFAWLEAAEGLAARQRGEVGTWTHPAVFRAAREMGHELRTGEFAACRRRWERALQREFAAGWGEAVPRPPLQVAHDTRTGPPPEAIRGRVHAILRAAGRMRGVA